MLTQKLLAIATGGSDWILYFLLFLSICSIAVIIERFFTLRTILLRSRKVGERAREAIKANDLKVLDDLSRDADSLEGRLLNYALRYSRTNGANNIDEIMSSYILMERPQLDRNLGFLATVGSNAAFIGLLGTVLGIVRAFADLAGSQGNPALVMAGISEALIATAVGIFVAIPAVAAYNYFQKQVKHILFNAESIKQLCIAYAKQVGGAYASGDAQRGQGR